MAKYAPLLDPIRSSENRITCAGEPEHRYKNPSGINKHHGLSGPL
jgi:hypothetical protein